MWSGVTNPELDVPQPGLDQLRLEPGKVDPPVEPRSATRGSSLTYDELGRRHLLAPHHLGWPGTAPPAHRLDQHVKALSGEMRPTKHPESLCPFTRRAGRTLTRPHCWHRMARAACSGYRARMPAVMYCTADDKVRLRDVRFKTAASLCERSARMFSDARARTPAPPRRNAACCTGGRRPAARSAGRTPHGRCR